METAGTTGTSRSPTPAGLRAVPLLLALSLGLGGCSDSEGGEKTADRIGSTTSSVLVGEIGVPTNAGGPSAFCHVTDGAFTSCPGGGTEWSDVPAAFTPETGSYLYANQADLDPMLGTPTQPVDTFTLMYDVCARTTPLGPDEYFLVNFNTVEVEDGTEHLEFYSIHVFGDGTIIFLENNEPVPAEDGSIRAVEIEGQRGHAGFGPSPNCAEDHLIAEFEIKLSEAVDVNGGYSPQPLFWSSTSTSCSVAIHQGPANALGNCTGPVVPAGTIMNVGEFSQFCAQVTMNGTGFPVYQWGIADPSSVVTNIDDLAIKDYSETVQVPYGRTLMQPTHFDDQTIDFYWKPDPTQVNPTNLGPRQRTLEVDVSVGTAVSCPPAKVTINVERNFSDANKQAEDFYNANHQVPNSLAATPPTLGLVGNEHQVWHRNNSLFMAPVNPGGNLFFSFHRQFIDRFNSWRAEFGYPAVTPWEPPAAIVNTPGTVDMVHPRQAISLSTNGGACCCQGNISIPYSKPTWFTVPPGGPPRTTSPGVCVSTFGDPFSQTDVCDFPVNQNLLGCAAEATWHNLVHCTLGIPANLPTFSAASCNSGNNTTCTSAFNLVPQNDMGTTDRAPRDPIFWRWHEAIDVIQQDRSGVGSPCSEPVVAYEVPFRLFHFITALPSVSVRFSQPVTGVQPGDVTVNGSPATNVTGSGFGLYEFTGFAAPSLGDIAVAMNAGSIINGAGEGFPGTSWSYTLVDPNADSDGDGLNNHQEANVFRTDPTAADTENDGLPDSYELQHACLSSNRDEAMPMAMGGQMLPAEDDSDHDGLTNLEEFLGGTDPCTRTFVAGRHALRSGFDMNFDASALAATDDGSTAAVDLGFMANFFGATYSSAFVNNNGNLTLDSPLSDFTPFELANTPRVIIAPFFADVDTRTGNTVKYGAGRVDGHSAFGVTWPGVGCFNQNTSVLDYFQVVLIDRSDLAPGDFDIEFNYDQIQWETGQASGGDPGCLGGTSARAGFSNGSGLVGTFFELPGSGVPGALLDTNLDTGLVHGSLNSLEPGRYVFPVRGGTPTTKTDTDGDQVADELDNCPTNANTDQSDANLNGIGDACEAPDTQHDTAAFLQALPNPDTIIERTGVTVADEPDLLERLVRIVEFELDSGRTTSPETLTANLVQSLVDAGILPADQAQALIDAVLFEVFCGNGVLDPGEQCDDGNEDDDDHCSQCMVVNRPPVAECKDVSVSADRRCRADASVDNGSSDPEGDAFVCEQSPSGPYRLGMTGVTLSCEDVFGSTDSCTATVTVVDTTGPVFTLVPRDIETCSREPPHGRARARDNCSRHVRITSDAGRELRCGTTTITWTATDQAGNTTTATQKVRRLCGHECARHGRERIGHH